jgi:hypothetical protein
VLPGWAAAQSTAGMRPASSARLRCAGKLWAVVGRPLMHDYFGRGCAARAGARGRGSAHGVVAPERPTKPAATTWAAEFLLREGESRECLGSWIHSNAVHEAKKRRAKQVITCSFPCGKWLHRIGVRTSPGCELCKRERRKDMASPDALPMETVAHIQSAGCKAQRKSVIGAHNRCWGYLRGAILTHGEAKRSLEFIGGDQDRQL